MTILLYDYSELEERAAKSLKVWKAWHLILYTCAAVFGIVNYVFLHKSMELVDGNCVLYPRALEFHMIARPDFSGDIYVSDVEGRDNVAQTPAVHDNSTAEINKRESPSNNTVDNSETSVEIDNNTIITGNVTHSLALYTSRSLFGEDDSCQFPEYMPIMSTVLAGVWLTFFTMCPGGGRVRTGLPQPWRILAPALIFALVMVGLTGHSFTSTNSGIQAFCTAFQEVTNSTNCSPVNDFLELGWNATWGFGGRVAATRATSAGVWASWACAAALLLARCLAAPDFQVKRSKVYLTSDPEQKITPFLKKSSSRRSNRSSRSSPTKRDNVSIYSEPTATTELATVSVEPAQDSAPTSLLSTPVRKDANGEMIEMTYTDRERLEH